MIHVCENEESYVCKNVTFRSCKYNIIFTRSSILYEDLCLSKLHISRL